MTHQFGQLARTPALGSLPAIAAPYALQTRCKRAPDEIMNHAQGSAARKRSSYVGSPGTGRAAA